MSDSSTARKRYKPPAPVRHFESGYEVGMAEVARLMLDLRDDGASDEEQITAALELVELRMILGAQNPVELLTEVEL